jgi:3-deoxy-manno-octulosonate cytidylyltransferase (CMP-KDO synthetase)
MEHQEAGMKAVIVIPARLESTRLPGKLLLNETGKPLIQHTWEQACKVEQADRVIIATDSREIVNECKGFGALVVLTRSSCRNGTERVAEVARLHPEVDVFVNIQADEPEINPRDVERLVEEYDEGIWTLACPISSDQAHDPNRTKVVTDDGNRAMYFSRSKIPYNNDPWASTPASYWPYWQHIGIYAYSRRVLQHIARLPIMAYESTEQLEQLRWLQCGQTVTVMPIENLEELPQGINTREDYDAFVERQKVMA